LKVLVTGYEGLIGHDIIKRLEFLDIECMGVDIEEFDLLDSKQTLDFISHYKPTVVVHCTEYEAIDRAEQNKDLCYNINVRGTENIAKACKKVGSAMMYISSNYVFDGKKKGAFKVNDDKHPVNQYGISKSCGEDALMRILDEYYVVRVSWVFGRNGRNFVNTTLNRAKLNDKICVECDQIGSPTYMPDLAKLIVDIIQTKDYGIYHATNEGYCSLYEFAKKILEYTNIDCKIVPISTEMVDNKANRILNARLDNSKLETKGFSKLRNWQEALQDYLLDVSI